MHLVFFYAKMVPHSFLPMLLLHCYFSWWNMTTSVVFSVNHLAGGYIGVYDDDIHIRFRSMLQY